MISIWGLMIAIGIFYYFWSFYKSISKLPPGPTAFPLVGNFLNELSLSDSPSVLGLSLHLPYMSDDLLRLGKKFGSVFTFHMPFPVVNICDYETLKEAYKTDDITGKDVSAVAEMLLNVPNAGLTLSSGDNWREQRRATIAILRDFGMGKNLMEQKVQATAEEMLQYLKKQKNLDSIDLHKPLQLFVSNVINEFMFGFRYDYENSDRLFAYVEEVTRLFMLGAKSKSFFAALRFPILRHVPFIKSHVNEMINQFEVLRTHFKEDVAELLRTYNEDEEPTNYIHAYMRKMKENPALRVNQLMDNCNDLFLAGQETTTTTLRWAMLLLATNQEVQDKIREEIHSVIGRNRLAVLSDRARMPYTLAAIHEIQRRANIIPLNVFLFHRATVDTKIGDYNIPAGTMVNGDLYQIHKSDPHFVEPEKFMPERYLAEDGKTMRKELVERTIPFGIGKRQCAGEGLARVELFIGLTTVLQNFRVLPTAANEVDLEPFYGTAMLPKKQNLRLVPV